MQYTLYNLKNGRNSLFEEGTNGVIPPELGIAVGLVHWQPCLSLHAGAPQGLTMSHRDTMLQTSALTPSSHIWVSLCRLCAF